MCAYQHLNSFQAIYTRYKPINTVQRTYDIELPISNKQIVVLLCNKSDLFLSKTISAFSITELLIEE